MHDSQTLVFVKTPELEDKTKSCKCTLGLKKKKLKTTLEV